MMGRMITMPVFVPSRGALRCRGAAKPHLAMLLLRLFPCRIVMDSWPYSASAVGSGDDL